MRSTIIDGLLVNRFSLALLLDGGAAARGALPIVC
jgi:hypothetical protein